MVLFTTILRGDSASTLASICSISPWIVFTGSKGTASAMGMPLLAIDGTHIPQNNPEDYYNRKCFSSVML